MTEYVDAFRLKYPAIKIDEDRFFYMDEDDQGNEIEIEEVSYLLSSMKGFDGITLSLSTEEDFEQFSSILESGAYFFKDLVGGKFDDHIEVVASSLTRQLMPLKRLGRPLEISVNYKGSAVRITLIATHLNKHNIEFISRKINGIRLQRTIVVVKIAGLKDKNPLALENSTKEILRSVLFDIENSYGLALEAAFLESVKLSKTRVNIKYSPLPEHEIQLLFKDYTPEIVEYFHIAEKVDYLPFKYICYFHVIEYFMDKSAFNVVSRKLKQLILSPDFHIKSNEYISHAIKIIKAETEKNTTDKIKISRVISEFSNKDSLVSFLNEINLMSHFNVDQTLSGNKGLKVSAIKFDTDNNFVDSITKRIYSIRCSIVHSNPEFDENKAVPFVPSAQNIDFLRKEIELIKKISNMIIVNSLS